VAHLLEGGAARGDGHGEGRRGGGLQGDAGRREAPGEGPRAGAGAGRAEEGRGGEGEGLGGAELGRRGRHWCEAPVRARRIWACGFWWGKSGEEALPFPARGLEDFICGC
jgi:hypothetical protein